MVWEKYAFWVTLRLLGSMQQSKAKLHTIIIRQGEAKLRIFDISSVFHHVPSVGPKQLCALAHLGCTRAAGTS